MGYRIFLTIMNASFAICWILHFTKDSAYHSYSTMSNISFEFASYLINSAEIAYIGEIWWV